MQDQKNKKDVTESFILLPEQHKLLSAVKYRGGRLDLGEWYLIVLSKIKHFQHQNFKVIQARSGFRRFSRFHHVLFRQVNN